MRIRGQPDPIAGLRAARSASLYLVSLSGVASALLAWPGQGGAARLPAAALGLAASLALGEWASPALDAALERRSRARLRASLGLAYAALALLGLAAAVVTSDALLLRRAVWLFCWLQALFLLLIEVVGGPLLCLANALTLSALAALAGGLPAAAGVTGYVGALVFFLAFDHSLRRLSVYPAVRAPLLRATLGRAVGAAAPLVLTMAALFVWAPPTPSRRTALGFAVSRSAEADEAYRRLLILGLSGVTMVWFVTRILRPSGRGRELVQEIPELERGTEEAIEPLPRPKRRVDRGSRGRVVRAYLRFLAAAERRGLRRPPAQTPSAVAEAVREPARPLTRLTALFLDARYGPEEPDAEAVRAAEAASAELVENLRRRRAWRPVTEVTGRDGAHPTT